MKLIYKIGITTLFFLSSISYAKTPLQQILDIANQTCSQSTKYGVFTYEDCSTSSFLFPVANDSAFQKKLVTTINNMGLRVDGDLITSIEPRVNNYYIYHGTVVELGIDYFSNVSAFDKAGNEYGLSIFYAPYTNKMIIQPLSRNTEKYAGKWGGDLKDPMLRKAILEHINWQYRVYFKPRIGPVDNPEFKGELLNKNLREIKINLGITHKIPGFSYYDANFKLPSE